MVPELSVLILPLLGGAVFCWYCDFYQYQFFRRSGYEFFFMAALSGSFLLLGSYWVVQVIHAFPDPRLVSLLEFLRGALPDQDHLGTLALTVPAGWVAAKAVNYFLVSDSRDIKKNEIEEHGDELEWMITRAVYGTYTSSQLYMVTLSTGKVYIGVVASGVDPYLERTHLTLLKFGSGYRTSTHNIEIETTYGEILGEISKENGQLPSHITSSDLEVVLPKSEVIQMSRFEPKLRDYFPEGPEVLRLKK